MFFFTVLPFVDMIIALKLLIVVVWIGAGVSKFGPHFTNVIPPMVSNSPAMPSKWVKRAHYRNFPNDLRPSHLASFMAHGPGTVVEIVAPLTLLLSPWPWLTIIAAVIMVAFHLFIISTFPLAVPLEWNVLFAYATIFLFLGFPNWDGYGIADMSSPWLTVAIVAGLLFFPVLGNLRPDLVSFLPSMRQYAGNWASAVWAFAPGAEEKLNRVTRSRPQPGRPAGRLRLRAAVGGDLQRSRRSRGGPCTARAAACSRCWSRTSPISTPGPCVRRSSSATR